MQSQIPSVPSQESQSFEGTSSTEFDKITLLLIGTSFKTSPIVFRERLADILGKNRDRFQWLRNSAISEIATLLTCNRIEFYVVTKEPETVVKSFEEEIGKMVGYDSSFFYVKENFRAIHHLFRVGASLDSMALGEEQIAAQLRESGVKARLTGNSKSVLPPLFDAAYNASKRIRADTRNKIYSKSNSASSLALELAMSRLGGRPKNVLLIGSGKMARLTMRSLADVNLFVVTKRKTSPVRMNNVTMLTIDNFKHILGKCELIITATSGPDFVIQKNDLPETFKGVIVDLGFPRNVDPSLGKNGSCELYNLDDLAKVERRSSSIDFEKVERSVLEEAESFDRWLKACKLSPVLPRLYSWMESIRKRETVIALSRLGQVNERERRVIESMGKRIMSKLLAKPTSYVKRSSSEMPQNQRLKFVEELFELNGDELDDEK